MTDQAIEKSHSDYDTEEEREAFRDGWQAANREIERLRADNKLLSRSLGIGWSGPVSDAIARSMQNV